MWDSITPGDIPADAQAVAGYVNGAWPTARELPAQFPGRPVVTIDVNGSRPDALVLDVESGDATAAQAPGWVRAAQARGTALPVIYTSVSNVASVWVAMRAAGIADSEWCIWTAHYTDVPHLCSRDCKDASGRPYLPGSLPPDAVVATQYADHGPRGEHADVSLCRAGWPA